MTVMSLESVWDDDWNTVDGLMMLQASRVNVVDECKSEEENAC